MCLFPLQAAPGADGVGFCSEMQWVSSAWLLFGHLPPRELSNSRYNQLRCSAVQGSVVSVTKSTAMVQCYQMENSRHNYFVVLSSTFIVSRHDKNLTPLSMSYPDPLLVFLISICYPSTSHSVDI